MLIITRKSEEQMENEETNALRTSIWNLIGISIVLRLETRGALACLLMKKLQIEILEFHGTLNSTQVDWPNLKCKLNGVILGRWVAWKEWNRGTTQT